MPSLSGHEAVPAAAMPVPDCSAIPDAEASENVAESDVSVALNHENAGLAREESPQARQARAAASMPVYEVPPVPEWRLPALEGPKINLGCGPSIIADWVNLDLQPRFGAHFWDATKGIPARDNVISLIYTEHFIEHLTLGQGLNLLRECVRVLCPGGILRLSTPDLWVLMRAYEAGALDYWLDVGWGPRNACDLFNQGMRAWGHQYLFDRPRLAELLVLAGFEAVAPAPWGDSVVDQLRGRETRPFHGDLIFEAQKRMN